VDIAQSIDGFIELVALTFKMADLRHDLFEIEERF
jgi:hypothetical protein